MDRERDIERRFAEVGDEITSLRDSRHKHAQILATIPDQKRRITDLEPRVTLLEKQVNRMIGFAMAASAVTSIAVDIVIRWLVQ